MVQKPLKIRPPCHILPDYFLTRLSFKNLIYLGVIKAMFWFIITLYLPQI